MNEHESQRLATHAAAVVRSLNRGQVTSLLKASEARSNQRADRLDEIWDIAGQAQPSVTSGLAATFDAGKEGDLPKFRSYRDIEDRQFQDVLQSPAATPIVVGVTALFMFVSAIALTTLLGFTPLVTLLATLGAAVAIFWVALLKVHGLKIASDLMWFDPPQSAANSVWISAVDAAASVALRDSVGDGGLRNEHLDELSQEWIQAGLDLRMLTPPEQSIPDSMAA